MSRPPSWREVAYVVTAVVVLLAAVSVMVYSMVVGHLPWETAVRP